MTGRRELAKTLVKSNIHFKTSELMREVPDGTIQAVITSPPYWYLKDYGHVNQIGFGESYETYHKRLDKVWAECYRALRCSGTMWIVIDKITFKDQIRHIPYDIVLHCKKLGFLLQDIVIWNKPTAIAGMTPRNLVNKHEYVLFFSRSRLFKFRLTTDASMSTPNHSEHARRLTDFWRFPVKAGSLRKTPNHKAPFPEELVRRIILLSTDEGDVVLDPFVGSGTTMKVALQLQRKIIGYEINATFRKVILQRMSDIVSSSPNPQPDDRLD